MKKFISKWWMFIAGIPFVLSSCLNSDYTPPDYDQILENAVASTDQTQLASDLLAIDDSLTNVWHYDDVLTEPNGVRYRILEMGTGAKPALTDVITVEYTAILMADGENGTPFASSAADGQSLRTYLYNLIAGWQLVLPLIPMGSTVRLYIPSGYGYGTTAQTDTDGSVIIPENSNLIFEIELVNVEQQ